VAALLIGYKHPTQPTCSKYAFPSFPLPDSGQREGNFSHKTATQRRKWWLWQWKLKLLHIRCTLQQWEKRKGKEVKEAYAKIHSGRLCQRGKDMANWTGWQSEGEEEDGEKMQHRKNTLICICCQILHNIWSLLHNIWQCYNHSATYCNNSIKMSFNSCTTYTKVLHNICIHYATYVIILHNICAKCNINNAVICCPFLFSYVVICQMWLMLLLVVDMCKWVWVSRALVGRLTRVHIRMFWIIRYTKNNNQPLANMW